MDYNALTTIPAFLPITYAKWFNFSRNAITAVDTFAFVYGNLLSSIDISHNMITSIDFLALMSPYSLFVDVSYNQIRDLSLGVISNSVTNLKLAGNIITTLSQNIFITATGLRSFDISENAISYLPQNCFQYCEMRIPVIDYHR